MEIKGYKVFNPDWTCRGFQYEVGKIYEIDDKPELCKKGFHFCEKAADCFNYYAFNSMNKVAEVLALGEIVTQDDKSCTNKIQIVREIPWEEVLEIVDMSPEVWWRSLPNEEKKTIMSILNFDADIFEEITGINVKEEK